MSFLYSSPLIKISPLFSTHKDICSLFFTTQRYLSSSLHHSKISLPFTTLYTTTGLLLKLSRVCPVQSLDGRPDAAGSSVGGPVRGTLSSGLKKNICPRAMIGDTALCGVLSFRWDVKWESWLFEVIKDPMALIVRVGVLTLVSWLNCQSGPQTVMVT